EIMDTSEIGFTAYQKGQPVKGEFEEFVASVKLDPEQPESGRISVEIMTDSITTGHKDRDGALRSSSFFETKTWPSATFASDRIEANGSGTYDATGKLTIRDVTKEVVLPFTLEVGPDPDDPSRQLATARGDLTISRLDYGVGQGDFASTSTVGDEVDIHIEIDATRPK
ncbi:MAG: YceI family protein, partial [Geminicoccaceae bacterium]|nr:YceI family protein [Geminicoccaceae bacterium]